MFGMLGGRMASRFAQSRMGQMGEMALNSFNTASDAHTARDASNSMMRGDFSSVGSSILQGGLYSSAFGRFGNLAQLGVNAYTQGNNQNGR